MSTLAGMPFWNSTVMRSYPEWVPVRIVTTYATGGDAGTVGLVTNPVLELQENAGRLESGGVACALGVGLDVCGALAVGLAPTPGTVLVGWWLSGLPTNRTPITTTAMTAAATPAIQ